MKRRWVGMKRGKGDDSYEGVVEVSWIYEQIVCLILALAKPRQGHS
jgi:hypothetical protein